jgi:hypothetical protein
VVIFAEAFPNISFRKNCGIRVRHKPECVSKEEIDDWMITLTDFFGRVFHEVFIPVSAVLPVLAQSERDLPSRNNEFRCPPLILFYGPLDVVLPELQPLVIFVLKGHRGGRA